MQAANNGATMAQGLYGALTNCGGTVACNAATPSLNVIYEGTAAPDSPISLTYSPGLTTALPTSTSCNTTIIKMRRLLPHQAGYRLLGETQSNQGEIFSHAYFVDEKNIIRCFAIHMEPGKNILKNLSLNEQWAGFVNLDLSTEQKSLTLYAYSDSKICQGEKIDLPEYIKPTKKQSEHGQEP